MRQLYLELYLALLAALLVRHTHAVMCKEITSSNWTNLGADDQCPGGTLYAGENDADSAEGQSRQVSGTMRLREGHVWNMLNPHDHDI